MTERSYHRRYEVTAYVEIVQSFRGRKEIFYLTTHSTHFIYGYMASDIWLMTTQIVREETRCCHMGYSFRLAGRVLLYAPPHDRIAHTTAFVTLVVEHWLERCYDECQSLFGPKSRLFSYTIIW